MRPALPAHPQSTPKIPPTHEFPRTHPYYIQTFWSKLSNRVNQLEDEGFHKLGVCSHSTNALRFAEDVTMSKIGKVKKLEDLKVNQLKSLLREKGLPVGGRKAELIEKLRNGPKLGPKPKAWQHSETKKSLRRALLDPKSPIHGMTVEQIHQMDERYKRYPNFPKYYKDLKAQLQAEKERVNLDDAMARMHIRDCPRTHLTVRGYPHWKNHPAKKLLESDVANKLHERMAPTKLRQKRKEYMEFPAAVFAKRINREADKQRSAQFWADKRNKRAMKKYLQQIARQNSEEVVS